MCRYLFISYGCGHSTLDEHSPENQLCAEVLRCIFIKALCPLHNAGFVQPAGSGALLAAAGAFRHAMGEILKGFGELAIQYADINLVSITPRQPCHDIFSARYPWCPTNHAFVQPMSAIQEAIHAADARRADLRNWRSRAKFPGFDNAVDAITIMTSNVEILRAQVEEARINAETLPQRRAAQQQAAQHAMQQAMQQQTARMQAAAQAVTPSFTAYGTPEPQSVNAPTPRPAATRENSATPTHAATRIRTGISTEDEDKWQQASVLTEVDTEAAKEWEGVRQNISVQNSETVARATQTIASPFAPIIVAGVRSFSQVADHETVIYECTRFDPMETEYHRYLRQDVALERFYGTLQKRLCPGQYCPCEECFCARQRGEEPGATQDVEDVLGIVRALEL